MIFLFLNPINIKRLRFLNLNNDDTAEKRAPSQSLAVFVSEFGKGEVELSFLPRGKEYVWGKFSGDS